MKRNGMREEVWLVVTALTLRLRDLLMSVLVWVIKAARLFAVAYRIGRVVRFRSEASDKS